MVRIEGPNCAHVNYAASFPKAYLSGMKWILQVFSAFDEPDTNKKVMKVGKHVREIAEEAIKKYSRHDVKGYLSELKKAYSQLERMMLDLAQCLSRKESEKMPHMSQTPADNLRQRRPYKFKAD
ncbi:hypothetical protein DdX_14465 [Ditylenchus destructor]|uniref:Uncharacterized protein n=1 Tax=Ditylenchus destructor TaxID=166010 RepID=A0AAD4R1N7_9BILA|nr:hypothetical protein DdX_14465 [Ditylenchus destructor]